MKKESIHTNLRATRRWCASGLFLVFLAIGSASFGQGRASLSGRVTDTQGAIIPSAVVTATRIGTGAKIVTRSNPTGFYVFPSLPASSYSISVSATGFKRYDQVGILVQANQSVTADVTLQPGEQSETVRVSAVAAQVNTTTGTLSNVIGQHAVENLPLNGRNAAQLSEETAGVILGPNNGADQGTQKTFPAALTISVNGSRSSDTNFMFDGGNNNDEYFMVNQPFPFPDALQEFSIQTSNYTAQYGQDAGGIVNIISKSGTQAFHGDLFEYVRNGMFNAANFFSSTVDPLKRNQFGGTIGGPVEIPHLFKTKHAFFFVGYQRTILRDQQGGVSSFVPTQANLRGDFSALLSASNPDNPTGAAVQLINPHTLQPYVGNIIDPATFDPASVAIMRALPGVAGNGATFYRNPVRQDLNEILVRGDQDITSKDHLTEHFYRNSFTNAGVYDPHNLLTYNDQSTIPVLSALVSETHTFSPHVLNDLVVNYSREVSTRGPVAGVPNIASFGVNIPQPPANALVGLSVDGYFSFGAAGLALFRRNNYTLTDDVSWVRGAHTMSFGVHAELSKVDIDSFFNNSGSFGFTADTTNNAAASFLLGYLNNFQQGNGQYFNDRNQFYGLYAQDSWRITPKLTLNYGLRWEPSRPWQEINNKTMQFSPTGYAEGRVSTVYPLAPPGLFFPGDAGVPKNGVKPIYDKFMPRFGFAYDVRGDGTLSIRGGAGVFFDTRLSANFNSVPSEISPFSTSVSLTDVQGPFSDPYRGIPNPFVGPPQPPATYVFPLPVQVNAYDPSGIFHVPVVYMYNLAVEKSLSRVWVLSVAYVGSHSSHLYADNDYNPSTYIPGSTLGTNARRHFPGFSDINIYSMSGDSNYNSGQVTVRRHVSTGLDLSANYTYSKSMDTLPYLNGISAPSSGPGAPYAIPIYEPDYKRLDIGPSDFDRTHVFSGSYVWTFPRMMGGNGLMRALLNDWVTTGIVQAQTGQPITITAGKDVSGTGLLADRAQWNGENPYGAGACKSSSVPCKSYLNPADFSLPAPGTFGNVTKGKFRGPGYFDWDAGVARRFPFGGSRVFELRAEYFNVINRNNLNNPITSISSGGFGQISSSTAAESPISPRVAQFSGKLVF